MGKVEFCGKYFGDGMLDKGLTGWLVQMVQAAAAALVGSIRRYSNTGTFVIS